tara:strand:+ start:52 stop:198 length:147 start_codon:yes stop_codon:yes gene_type:complete
MKMIERIKTWLRLFILRAKGLYLPKWKPSEKQVTPNEVKDGTDLRKWK